MIATLSVTKRVYVYVIVCDCVNIFNCYCYVGLLLPHFVVLYYCPPFRI